MGFKETVVRGHVTSSHLVQLFDSRESLVAAVSSFAFDGLTEGDTVLVVSSAERWAGITDRLIERGVSTADAEATGQLVSLDAQELLQKFMKNQRPEPRLFEESVGATVRGLASRAAPLRIYGEMVDVLAARGEYRAAHELEELWNALGERESFTLFCGYSAEHFGDPRTAESLRSICRAHSSVHVDPRDLLSTYLVQAYAETGATPARSGF
jgi:hypothetical protein